MPRNKKEKKNEDEEKREMRSSRAFLSKKGKRGLRHAKKTWSTSKWAKGRGDRHCWKEKASRRGAESPQKGAESSGTKRGKGKTI